MDGVGVETVIRTGWLRQEDDGEAAGKVEIGRLFIVIVAVTYFFSSGTNDRSTVLLY